MPTTPHRAAGEKMKWACPRPEKGDHRHRDSCRWGKKEDSLRKLNTVTRSEMRETICAGAVPSPASEGRRQTTQA
ncbi:hypothetical protein chiPu_0002860 [Chiloscyllium punctatum]|uniref:Uncharacterized protein n=1 Tax=Chiloscyllium punctatum TaxID=137246 RepID=A0A401S266_CHIPU|nr:hypothetical protein [Chiloscyllium punctatum]